MTTPIQGTSVPAIFNFESHDIRAFADEHGEPWFLAADVCEVLGYRNPSAAVSKHCREAGVTKRDISSGGQMREVTYINEGNLYRLIVKSRKPEAEKFERLVMEEILPSIRKTSEYRAPYAGSTQSIQPGDITNPAYYRECRDALFAFADSLPSGTKWPQDEAKRQRIADGYLTNILSGRRWLMSFDHQGCMQTTPVPMHASIVDATDPGELHTLIFEFVPLELLTKVIDSANCRIAQHLQRLAKARRSNES